ncbi:MAG: beta-glucan endohydrolase [Frankiales bacterium]|nr:beta-glucan endohydrolase [Frankiales bacterium]
MRHPRLVLLGTVLLALVVLGWAGFRGLQVRNDLTAAQSLASSVQQQLTGGDSVRAEASLPALRSRIDRAAGRTQGLAWALTEHVPLLGGNFRAVRRTALAAQVLGDRALPEAVAALDLVRSSKPIRNGKVDLAVLAHLKARVDRAAAAGDRAQALLAPHDGFLLGPVSSKVDEGRTKVVALAGALRSARTALAVAPSMLGESGPRTYYVAVQNNAEARATGGLVGAFALIKADRGVISLEHTGTDAELALPSKPVPSDPSAAATWTDEGSTQAWYDANLTPHWPDAARNLAGQWTAQSHQTIDGVIGLDPLVMSELLKATGPVRLTDGTSVSADSVIDFVGHEEYVRYTDNAKRKTLLGTLAADLFHKVLAADSSVGTLQAFARAGSSGHLALWSAHAAEQAHLAGSLVGGSLPTQDVPYLSVLTQNFGGNKLDFYVRRSVAVVRDGHGLLRVTTTLRNVAPLGLPPYMSVRSDQPTPPVPYGQARVGFSVYAALSSEVRRVLVDGKPQLISLDRDHGHRMGTLTLELPRAKDVVVTVLISEPKGELTYRQQPLVQSDVLDIRVPHRVVGR